MYIEEQLNKLGESHASLVSVVQDTLAHIKQKMDQIEAQLEEIKALESVPKEIDRDLTTKEAAEYLGISVGYLRYLVSNKEIPYFKNIRGSRLFFRTSELALWQNTKGKLRQPTQEEIDAEAARQEREADALRKRQAMTKTRKMPKSKPATTISFA
jgi:excisionase